MKKYGFGVDIGGTTVKLGFFEADGRLIEKWEIATDKRNQGENILSEIASEVERKLAERGVSKEEVLGIGVGVPGPVGADGVVNGCVNLGWGRVSPESELSALTGLAVKAGNDANVAALGEMWQGGGKGCGDMIMVTLGTGVGGGIITSGRMVCGGHGAGGEIGHITVNADETERCNCGRRGCLEQYTSATGIVRMAEKRLAADDTPTVLRDCGELSAKAVFDAARTNDPVAVELADEVGRILGGALANIACVTDPEVIVIGGGVSRAGDVLIDPIKTYYAQSAFHACRGTEFAPALLGNDAGIYGCMRLLLE